MPGLSTVQLMKVRGRFLSQMPPTVSACGLCVHPPDRRQAYSPDTGLLERLKGIEPSTSSLAGSRSPN